MSFGMAAASNCTWQDMQENYLVIFPYRFCYNVIQV